jgi:hypothetical protein
VLRAGGAFTFLPSEETAHLRYFPAGIDEELAPAVRPPLRWQSFDDRRPGHARILLLTGHGSDLSEALRELRQLEAPGSVLAIWLWDNHIAAVSNSRVVREVDVVFPSHAYESSYLENPASVLGPHAPLCCAQWTRAEVARLFAAHAFGPRSDQLLVNYVDYAFSPRSALLRALAEQAPEADVLLMAPERRERYFSMTSEDRFREWARYKCTAILPVDADLSTRVFDALLAGVVPVVPRTVRDFDAVVPPAVQEALGIVRIDAPGVEALRAATAEAVRRFDALGAGGVKARHRYALESHMLADRVRAMAEAIVRLGAP